MQHQASQAKDQWSGCRLQLLQLLNSSMRRTNHLNIDGGQCRVHGCRSELVCRHCQRFAVGRQQPGEMTEAAAWPRPVPDPESAILERQLWWFSRSARAFGFRRMTDGHGTVLCTEFPKHHSLARPDNGLRISSARSNSFSRLGQNCGANKAAAVASKPAWNLAL